MKRYLGLVKCMKHHDESLAPLSMTKERSRQYPENGIYISIVREYTLNQHVANPLRTWSVVMPPHEFRIQPSSN